MHRKCSPDECQMFLKQNMPGKVQNYNSKRVNLKSPPSETLEEYPNFVEVPERIVASF